MSFLKRLALFVLILVAMIFFVGLLPVVAQSAKPDSGNAGQQRFIMVQSNGTQGN